MRFGGTHRNVALCLVLECLWAIHFSVAITVEFYDQFGIDVATVLAIQALMSLVGTVCDAPFGYLAVRFGVRRMLLIGVVLQLLQSCLFAFWCRTVPEFIVTSCLTGVAWAFTYGTTKAMVTETDPEQIVDYSARAIQVRAAGQLFGVLVGGYLAPVSLSLPVMIQPIAFALALPAAYAIKSKETIHSRLAHPEFSSLIHISKLMLVTRAQVRWTVLLTTGINASVLAMLWLTQPDMKAAGVPLDMYGNVYAVRTVAAFVFAHFVQKVLRHVARMTIQIALTGVVVTCAAFAGLPTGLSGAIAILLANALATAVTDPLLTCVIKTQMPKELTDHGATVYSVASAVQSALFVVSPIMGWVNKHYSTDTALLCIAGCTLTFSCFCIYKLKQGLRL